jgi:hypothetical protein
MVLPEASDDYQKDINIGGSVEFDLRFLEEWRPKLVDQKAPTSGSSSSRNCLQFRECVGEEEFPDFDDCLVIRIENYRSAYPTIFNLRRAK